MAAAVALVWTRVASDETVSFQYSLFGGEAPAASEAPAAGLPAFRQFATEEERYGLVAQGEDTGLLGVLSHLFQQHGFAYSAQADEDHAFRRVADAHAADGDFQALPQLVATGQFGRGRAGAGGVGVVDGVHGFD